MGKITKDMNIIDVVRAHSETLNIFLRFGMNCLGCAAVKFENIEQGAMAHGINVELLMVALNESIKDD